MGDSELTLKYLDNGWYLPQVLGFDALVKHLQPSVQPLRLHSSHIGLAKPHGEVLHRHEGRAVRCRCCGGGGECRQWLRRLLLVLRLRHILPWHEYWHVGSRMLSGMGGSGALSLVLDEWRGDTRKMRCLRLLD
jgi:hypothetical protein